MRLNFVGLFFILINSVFVFAKGIAVEEWESELSILDGSLSVAGDCVDGKSKSLGCGAKLLGAGCGLLRNWDDPSLDHDTQAGVRFAEGLRVLSAASMLKKEVLPDGSQVSKSKRNTATTVFLSGALRLISTAAFLDASNKGGCAKNKKRWAVRRLIGSWSRAMADYLTGNSTSKFLTLCSVVVDSHCAFKVLNPEIETRRPDRLRRTDQQHRSDVRSEHSQQHVQQGPIVSDSSDVEGQCPICMEQLKSLDSKNLVKMSCCGGMICKSCLKQLIDSSFSESSEQRAGTSNPPGLKYVVGGQGLSDRERQKILLYEKLAAEPGYMRGVQSLPVELNGKCVKINGKYYIELESDTGGICWWRYEISAFQAGRHSTSHWRFIKKPECPLCRKSIPEDFYSDKVEKIR